jgi:hypothetical protein
MAKSGTRHRLVLYTYILNRWWRSTLLIGLLLLALLGLLVWLPSALPQDSFHPVGKSVLWLVGGLGAFAIFLALFLAAVRKSAYVQPCSTHLHLVTPFLRMNISYRRFIQASSADMGRLFPLDNLKGRKRAFLRPLSGLTAILLELKGWPLPRGVLELFLSPYFFPDRTTRLALLVPDWIRFSTELESFRGTWLDSIRPPGGSPQSDLLASLNERK